ncbi:MAG: hypothetical protein ACK5PW_17455 [Burkholderiales bacterium]
MARALPVGLELTSSHWGAWEIRREAGQPTGLAPWRGDPDPNPIGPAVWEADDLPCVRDPRIRTFPSGRGPRNLCQMGRDRSSRCGGCRAS